MIHKLNKLLNFIIKILRYLTFILAGLVWLTIYPLLYIIRKIRNDKNPLTHPNFLFITYIMTIDKFYKQFIF